MPLLVLEHSLAAPGIARRAWRGRSGPCRLWVRAGVQGLGMGVFSLVSGLTIVGRRTSTFEVMPTRAKRWDYVRNSFLFFFIHEKLPRCTH